jgi:hypothetical protein
VAITQTGQNIIDSLRGMPELAPIFQSQVSGFSLQTALDIINEAMAFMHGTNFPWKHNEIELPPFYVNSYQQDYASTVENLGWLQSGECLDVNNSALPKAQPQVECVKDLPRASSWVALPPMFFGNMKFQVCWRYNNQLYYGTWGQANSGTGNTTRGNNPVSGSKYTNPLSIGNQMPFNPITQIQDANGNLLQLTGYGTEGTTAPVAPANSAAGTIATPGSGATTQWTVLDPLGQGFRIWPTPSQSGVVWQFNLRGQAKPPALLTSLSTLLTPVPDELIHVFRQGCIAMAYKYSPEEKVRARYDRELARWEDVLMKGRMQGDREAESHAFIPVGGVVASPGGAMPVTPGNPFGVGGA